MCKKAVDTFSFLSNCIDNCCQQEREWWRNGYKKAASKVPFMWKHCLSECNS